MDHSSLGGHIHECDHCRPYWRHLRDINVTLTAPAVERGIECPVCGRPLVVARADGIDRCVECGIPDLESEGHVAQLWWSESPTAGALNVGWGGDDLWACSCGARDEDISTKEQGEVWADAHAAAAGGRVIPPTGSGTDG
jgi:hypothetical protein